MRLLFLIVFSTFVLTNLSFAQIKATTENGKDVLLYKDGSWDYKKSNSTITDSSKIKNPMACKNLVETSIDKMTGRKSTGAKGKLIVSSDGGKTGFGIYAIKSEKDDIILVVNPVGAGSCINEGTEVNILFRDGTRTKIIADNDFNCKSNVAIYFGSVFGKQDKLKELSTKEIETMRVWTRNSYVEQDFSKEQSQKFLYTLKCLVNQ